MVFRVVTWIITVIIGAVRALCENAPKDTRPPDHTTHMDSHGRVVAFCEAQLTGMLSTTAAVLDTNFVQLCLAAVGSCPADCVGPLRNLSKAVKDVNEDWQGALPTGLEQKAMPELEAAGRDFRGLRESRSK